MATNKKKDIMFMCFSYSECMNEYIIDVFKNFAADSITYVVYLYI